MTAAVDPGLAGDVARVLGHELGELAALFDGYIREVEDRPPAESMAALRRTTNRLRNVCESLRELADVAASEPAPATVDPAAAVAAARQRIRNPKLELRVGALPAVVADPGQLEQLFTHVLRSPALNGAAAPVVVVGGRTGAEVRLDVGIDPRDSDPAVDGDRSLVGRGIDLAVARELAERNGGRLWVVSDDRSGPTVSLTLPSSES